MSRIDPDRLFELEALEQRVMLSADPLLGAAAAWQIDQEDLLSKGIASTSAVEEIVLTADGSSATASSDTFFQGFGGRKRRPVPGSG